jgi:hypothetical protein
MRSQFLAVVALAAGSCSGLNLQKSSTRAHKTEQKTNVKLLNSPDQKLETRLDTLKKLKKRMKTFELNGLLADQKPYLNDVLAKIDSVLEMNANSKKSSKEKKEDLDKAIKDVQGSVNELKARFMKKVMDLQKEQEKRMAEINTSMGKTSTTAEKLFDKLMEVQDAPLQEQLAVLEPAVEDRFVKKFLTKHGYEVKDGKIVASADKDKAKEGPLKEGENIAMEFGKALDSKKEDDQMEEAGEEIDTLKKNAKLTEAQAKEMVPILENIKGQQADKKVKITQMEKKLSELEDTQRFFKKRKANLKREDHVLGEAVEAIEHGNRKKLQKVMEELSRLAHL